MSLISVFKTIGEDVEKGISIAAPIIGTFVPAAGPILTDIVTVISALESEGKTPSSSQMSTIVQSLSTANVIKQSAAAPKNTT